MVEVIYADILFIVNVYVNYALLKITALLLKRDIHILRVLLASAVGGLYAFIILVDNLHGFISAFSRIIFAFIIALVAFGYKGFKSYVRSVTVFFFTSFVFSGLMYFLWTFFSPPVMAYRNSVVYFDIDALDLCVMTIICYGFLKLLDIVLKSRQTQNVIYDMAAYVGDKIFYARAFLDTGNSLTEPFSSYPVIVLSESVKSADGEKISLSQYIENEEIHRRFVPCKTLNETTLLSAFRPDKVRIKGIDIDFETDKVYIAFTKNKIMGDEFDGLFGSAVLEGKTKETERDYSKQTV